MRLRMRIKYFFAMLLLAACFAPGCTSGQINAVVTGNVILLPGQEAKNIGIWVFWLDGGADEQPMLFPVDDELRFRFPLRADGAYDLQAVVADDEHFYSEPVRKIVKGGKLSDNTPVSFQFVEQTIYP